MKKLVQLSIFSYGFRPFFLGGAIWAATAMLLWTGMLTGKISFATPYSPIIWHAHELVFGYASAILGGFILTAVPNWTARSPIQGSTLIILFTIWLCGRVAFWFADSIGLAAAAVIDSLFLVAITAVAFREILAGQNRRNIKIAIIFGLFAAANIYFHVETLIHGLPFYSTRAGLSVLVILIMLVGGRIIPNFTRNFLVKMKNRNLPTPFNRFDALSIGFSILSLVFWVGLPYWIFTGPALLIAGALQLVRLVRWSVLQTVREPLVFILHLGFLFIPLGFFTVGSSVIWPQFVPTGIALHAWSTGAVGVMTLAVMTRASRGHTGRSLTAPLATQVIYFCVLISALTRLTTIFLPELTLELLEIASVAWIGAFALFAILYGPILLSPSLEE